jgi:predicted Zn-dependent protease
MAALSLDPDARTLGVTPAGGEGESWPLASLRRLPDRATGDPLVLGLAEEAGPAASARRLHVDGPARAALEPVLSPSAMPDRSLWRRVLLTWLGAALLLAGLFYAALPGLAGLLASRTAPEAQIALGDVLFGHVRDGALGLEMPLCTGAEGQAALDRLTALVAAGTDLPFPLRVVAIDDGDDELPNAFALPGGRIAFTESMILGAASPEEVAAVLAHELGHVVADDPMRGLLQNVSGIAVLSVLAGDVSGGGMLGGIAGGALAAGYTRGAERRADAFAVARMSELGVGGEALSAVFARLRDRYGEVGGVLAGFATHPRLTSRIELADAVAPSGPPRELLDPRSWEALRSICD